jgi:NAD(P)-dependent dehydrogenase (short-subunit alcohol dehydrogenase family)
MAIGLPGSAVAVIEPSSLDTLTIRPAGDRSNIGSIALVTATADPGSPMAMMASIPYPSSKTALNMVTAMYAKELRDTRVKVNAANPGYCATDLNGNNGFRTAEQGAEVSVHLATLPADGPSGMLWGYVWTAGGTESYGALPW